MQQRASQVFGDRPLCSKDPKHIVHIHGHYFRYLDCDGKSALVKIGRFLCTIDLQTISVLPDHFLPYRPIPVPTVQAFFDAQSRGESPPLSNELEAGCLKRAWTRFTSRVAVLAATLGQIVPFGPLNPKTFWLQLRRLGDLPAILLFLSRSFHISLLLNYLCLRPWSRTPG